MHRLTKSFKRSQFKCFFYSEPPQNVTLNATGADKLEISWSPPPELAVTLYIVIFQDETYHVDPSSDLVMDLDSLNTYTAYTCCVAANTASGASRIACVTKTHQETGIKPTT